MEPMQAMMELAKHLREQFEAECNGKAWADMPDDDEWWGRALQQYGDERAREARQEGIQIGLNGADLAVALAEGEARAAAIEEAEQAIANEALKWSANWNIQSLFVANRQAVSALAAKPDATDADKARTERDGILYREGRAAGFEEAKEICRVQGVQALFSARALAAKPRSG